MRNILILLTLITGLIFTSLVKNKTRLLEKELIYLDNEINNLNSELSEASLDFQYLTTPKHISFLANNFLDEDFTYYKESQIKKTVTPEKDLIILKKSKNNNIISQLDTEELLDNKANVAKVTENTQLLITKNIKAQIAGDVFTGKETVKYLSILKKSKNNIIFSQLDTEELFNNKSNVEKKIDKKQSTRSKKIDINEKIHNWAGLQIVKSLLGIPVIPVIPVK